MGGGPAGAAVALGLARMGERVTVVTKPRRFAAIEGVSVRVVEALRGLGLAHALQAVTPPLPRDVIWNGEASSTNVEALVDRALFDQGLLLDMQEQGVRVLRGQVLRTHAADAVHSIHIETPEGKATLTAAFLVEARGRWAPGHGLRRVRGPETTSILQYWRDPGGESRAGSMVQSLSQGWAWVAAWPDGRRYLQLTLDARSPGLPARRDMGAWCRQRLLELAGGAPQLMGAAYARASTSVLHEAVAGSNWLRVGDAAMAVDPLSGNGIFQALSSALQAPPVIATLRYEPAQAPLAQLFHAQRVRTLFYRFARTGRDFYGMEEQWPKAPFWTARGIWPDEKPLHETVSPQAVHIARRPVVQDGRIVEAEVVVSPDQPLGVWHLDGLPLAPMLRALHSTDAATRPAEAVLVERCELSPRQAAHVVSWMRGQKWIA